MVPLFTLTREPVGPVRFGGSPASPVAYQGVDRSSFSLTEFGLMRAGHLAGQAVVVPADANGSVALGLMALPHIRHVVFGVAPDNPNHLIATGVITWDPYDICHILVGTIQNGVIRSTAHSPVSRQTRWPTPPPPPRS